MPAPPFFKSVSKKIKTFLNLIEALLCCKAHVLFTLYVLLPHVLQSDFIFLTHSYENVGGFSSGNLRADQGKKLSRRGSIRHKACLERFGQVFMVGEILHSRRLWAVGLGVSRRPPHRGNSGKEGTWEWAYEYRWCTQHNVRLSLGQRAQKGHPMLGFILWIACRYWTGIHKIWMSYLGKL